MSDMKGVAQKPPEFRYNRLSAQVGGEHQAGQEKNSGWYNVSLQHGVTQGE